MIVKFADFFHQHLAAAGEVIDFTRMHAEHVLGGHAHAFVVQVFHDEAGVRFADVVHGEAAQHITSTRTTTISPIISMAALACHRLKRVVSRVVAWSYLILHPGVMTMPFIAVSINRLPTILSSPPYALSMIRH